jgi:signal transduction histidine kinase
VTDFAPGAGPGLRLVIPAAALDVMLFSDAVFRSPSVRGTSTAPAVILAYAAAGAALLHLRHRRPAAVSVALSLHGAAAALFSSYRPVLLVLVALNGAARRRSGPVLGVALTVALGCQLTWVVAELRTMPGEATPSVAAGVWLSYLLLVLATFGTGRWRRAQTARDHAERRRRDQRLATERRYLGHDLHDTVAHALTVMSLRADTAARTLHRDPERARDDLDAVTATGRDAVGELHRIVTGLHGTGIRSVPGPPTGSVPGSAPGFAAGSAPGFAAGSVPGFAAGSAPGFAAGSVPGFAAGSVPGFAAGSVPGFAAGSVPGFAAESAPGTADLDALVRAVRGLGRRVKLTRVGTGPVDPRLECDAYRVVQESVTNALKHGPPDACIDIRVIRENAGFSVEVVDRAPPDPAGSGGTVPRGGIGARNDAGTRSGNHGRGTATVPGTGHGLTGMAERVHRLGGTFSAGPLADNGFRVRARWAPAHRPNRAPGPAPRQVPDPVTRALP